jgi:hypothetical protein
MRRRLFAPVLAAGCLFLLAGAALGADAPVGFSIASPDWFAAASEGAAIAPLAYSASTDEPLAFSLHRRRSPQAATAPRPEPVLGAERARTLLRSLTVPGWGQATIGHPTAARVFGLVELGVWASFTSFRIQERLRTDSYERTARLLAGIDLHGRDEEFRRIVGSYLSSDQYNLYVVARDAATLYYNSPDSMRAYIEAHELRGRDTWSWSDVNDLLRYRGQRKNAQRASLRANTALALAIANRLVSAVHAAREAGRGPTRPRKQSWNFEIGPAGGSDLTAFQLGVRTRF